MSPTYIALLRHPHATSCHTTLPTSVLLHPVVDDSLISGLPDIVDTLAELPGHMPSDNVLPIVTTVHELYGQVACDVVSFFLKSEAVLNLPRSTSKTLTENMIEILRNFGNNYASVLATSDVPVDLNLFFDISLEKLLTNSKIEAILRNQFDFTPPIEVTFPNSLHKLYLTHLPSFFTSMSCNPNLLRFLTCHSHENTFFLSPHFLNNIKPLADCAVYISLYSDEFEVVNPIGCFRKKHKLVALYFSILNFPPSYYSKLDNVFFLALGKQQLMHDVGICEFFKPAINMLRSCFNEPVTLIDGSSLPIIACFLSGDNLSVHGLVGIRRCFSSGNICRFCFAVHDDLLLPNKHCVLRTDSTYYDDFNLLSNGILYRSPLFDLPYWSFPDFTPPDMMHDCLEGVTHVVLCCALTKIMDTVSLDEVVGQLANFCFGFQLPLITKKHISNMHLPLTASQTLHFFMHFPLALGNLVTFSPLPDFWEAIVIHHELLCIFLTEADAPFDHSSQLIFRQNEILYNLCNNFPKAKCKIHFLTHYPRFLSLLFSCKYTWTMRFEGRHQYFKNFLRFTGQYKNVAYSCAQRFLIRSSLMMHDSHCFPSVSPANVSSTTLGNILTYEEMCSLQTLQQNRNVDYGTPCDVTACLNVNGHKLYTTKRMVLVSQRMFRVTYMRTNVKKVVKAESLSELVNNGCMKFGISEINVTLQTSEGLVIDDCDAFDYVALQNAEVFFVDNDTPSPTVNVPLPSIDAALSSCSNPVVSDVISSIELQGIVKKWPIAYRLPCMPLIENRLRMVKSKEEGLSLKMDSGLSNKLIGYLFTDLLAYLSPDEPYPTSHMYHSVCRALIVENPFLADSESCGGYNFWKVKLLQRFQDHRRKLAPSSKILEKRGMYTNKAKRKSGKENMPNEPPTRVRKNECHENVDEQLCIVVPGELTEEENLHERSDEESMYGSLAKKCDLLSSIGINDLSNSLDDEAMESIRKKTNEMSIAHKTVVLKNMKILFPYRVQQCQCLTVPEEINFYVHLQEPDVIYQQALLTFCEYGKTTGSDYVPSTSCDVSIPDKLEGVLIKWWSCLDGKLNKYREASHLLSITADSKELKMRLGFLYLAIRLRIPLRHLFDKANPVYIDGEANCTSTYVGVHVNGARLKTDGLKECLAVFISSFACFNLRHPKPYESLIEFLEAELGFRRKITKTSARQLLECR